MNKMGTSFLNDDNYPRNEYDNTSPSLSSGFQNVALSSLIPQVVAELLKMEYNNAVSSTLTSASNTNTHETSSNGIGINNDETFESIDATNLRMIR